LTDYKLTVEQTDLLLFQMNRLTYENTEVGIEAMDMNDKVTLSRPKQIVLKSTQTSTTKQNVLQNIMELLDTLGIIFKVVEPHLSQMVTR
jgi:hypothetical protein